MTEPNEPGTEVALAGGLRRRAQGVVATGTDLPPYLARQRDNLPRATVNRLRPLASIEAERHHQRHFEMPWATQDRAYGVVAGVSIPEPHGWIASKFVQEIDRAARRAAMMLDGLSGRRPVNTWPMPIRPSRGGLSIVWSQSGSLHFVLTAYGDLVSIAQSQPVSLVSLMALILDGREKAKNKVDGWFMRRMAQVSATSPPLPVENQDGDEWNDRTVRELVPVLIAAIDAGTGFELATNEIRLVVPPARQQKKPR